MLVCLFLESRNSQISRLEKFPQNAREMIREHHSRLFSAAGNGLGCIRIQIEVLDVKCGTDSFFNLRKTRISSMMEMNQDTIKAYLAN